MIHVFVAECMLCDWHHDKARLTIAEAEQDNRDHEAIHHKPAGPVHAIVPIENAAGELHTCGMCKRPVIHDHVTGWGHLAPSAVAALPEEEA